MSYQHLAQVYDRLMQEAPYAEWLEYVHRICQKYRHTARQVVDLGCGTGSLAIPLAQTGLEVIGLDVSVDMLTVAQEKGRKAGVSITWVEQDMTLLALPEQVDTVLCFCDSLNYIVEEDLIKQTFCRVYEHLHKDGLFIFDCHTVYQVEVIFGEHTFGLNEEEIAYLWQCHYNQDKYSVVHELSFFVQEEEQRYLRFDEVHLQRAYPLDKLQSWLVEAGFKVLEVTADFSEETPREDSQRVFFVAKK